MAPKPFENIVTLSLGNPDQPQEFITNLGFEGFVNNYTMLENISLNSIPNLKDSCIEAFTRFCKRLSAINLMNCLNLSDDFLESLKNCDNI